jgi:hypothetical protein
MPNKLPQSVAKVQATMDEILASRARLNQTSADFLKVDVATALTFCEIARGTHDLRKKLRNRQHARVGYDTIRYLLSKVTLTKEEAQYLAENLHELRIQLVALGEAF